MEFVTALRSTLDDQKPSLFEILSEQQLNSLLPPTLRYLLTVATHRYPRYLLRALNSFDELYALAMLVIERYYLRSRGGSFTEHFYGLKREKALQSEIPRAATSAQGVVRDTLKLTDGDVWKNLAVMVAVPYLKRKLDESHEIEAPRALLGASYTRMPPNPTIRQRLLHYYKWFVRNVYPSVHAAYYFSIIAFNLAYLFDNTKYHSPLMWLIGTRLRRMNGADYQAIEALGQPKSRPGNPPAPTSLLNPRQLGERALGSLAVLLPTSIFALKFLEWWYASDFAKQLTRKAAESLELPPPVVSGLSALGLDVPSHIRKRQAEKKKEEDEKKRVQGKAAAAKGEDNDDDDRRTPRADKAPIATPSLLPIFTVPAPEESDVCPICEDEITTATACQTGFVYCYSCIHKWIEGSHAKQEGFMAGSDPQDDDDGHNNNNEHGSSDNKGRAGKWESGQGRCAVTGRRVLGGTEGLRRIMV